MLDEERIYTHIMREGLLTFCDIEWAAVKRMSSIVAGLLPGNTQRVLSSTAWIKGLFYLGSSNFVVILDHYWRSEEHRSVFA